MGKGLPKGVGLPTFVAPGSATRATVISKSGGRAIMERFMD